MKPVLLAALLLSLLGGCARQMGQNFDLSRADSLVPGQSTVADATALFGPPVRTKKYLSNETVVRWHYLKDRPGGTESMTLDIRFDPDGKMLSIVRRDDHHVSAVPKPPAS